MLDIHPSCFHSAQNIYTQFNLHFISFVDFISKNHKSQFCNKMTVSANCAIPSFLNAQFTQCLRIVSLDRALIFREKKNMG